MRTYWLLGKEVYDPLFPPKQSPPSSHLSRCLTNKRPFSDFPSENSVELASSLTNSSNTNDSCLSLFHECKKNAKNETIRANGYRSAPVINFSELYPPSNFII
ncbi:hypothetical protein NPIL_49451 [Nephila pilipes]|nr:hypothetical protein NPIL_49451 [Nephila pilipes]